MSLRPPRLRLPLPDHRDTYALVRTGGAPTSAIVFVHGFAGSPNSTWDDFEGQTAALPWWEDADLFFYGYDTWRDEVSLSAERLNRFLAQVYPKFDAQGLIATDPPSQLGFSEQSFPDLSWTAPEVATEAPVPSRTYDRLLLVGHSLGGLVLRRAILTLVKNARPGDALSPVTDASLRLFAPALLGARLAGLKSLLIHADPTAALRGGLMTSSPYAEMQQPSQLLSGVQAQTTALCERHPDVPSLRADVVWAERDSVIISMGYLFDVEHGHVPNTSHTTVCKPRKGYTRPVTFVETGRCDG